MERKLTDVRKIIKEVEEEIVTSQSIVCNKCGKETHRKFDSEYLEDYADDLWNTEYQSFGCSFGYGSKFDTEFWNFELCEECLVDLIKSFKYVPDGFREDRSYYIIKDEEEHQKIFERWKETGKWEQLYFKTYEELVELADIFRTEYINKIIKQNYPDKPLINEED
jgi:hypothetical protein